MVTGTIGTQNKKQEWPADMQNMRDKDFTILESGHEEPMYRKSNGGDQIDARHIDHG
jgi:hypothetical protein